MAEGHTSTKTISITSRFQGKKRIYVCKIEIFLLFYIPVDKLHDLKHVCGVIKKCLKIMHPQLYNFNRTLSC